MITYTQKMVTESLEFLASVDNYNHRMAQTLSPDLGGKVLDLGCGIGSILQYFFMRQKLFGLDLDEKFIDYCKHKFNGRSNCEFIAGDIFKDEFNFSEKPDSITCMNVLEHIEDDNAALKWMNESVTDDGNSVFWFPLTLVYMTAISFNYSIGPKASPPSDQSLIVITGRK